MYLTNSALMYLNYTTRIVAKSSKVIPTMFLGTVRPEGQEKFVY